MTVENENFFDFFGITEDQVRTLYAQSGKLIYLPQIHVPVPPKRIPEAGIKSMGITVVTNKDQTPLWVDIFFWLSIVALIVTIIYIIWQLSKPETDNENHQKDDKEEDIFSN